MIIQETANQRSCCRDHLGDRCCDDFRVYSLCERMNAGIVVVKCRPIHVTEETGTLSSTENTYGTEVNVTCNSGYKINEMSSLLVNCTDNGTWSFEPVSCERKCIAFIVFIVKCGSSLKSRRLIIFSNNFNNSG